MFSTASMRNRSTSWSALERRSEEHTSELQSQSNLVCRLLLEKKKAPADVDDTPVSSIARQEGRFLITLESGREVARHAVLMPSAVDDDARRANPIDVVRADHV